MKTGILNPTPQLLAKLGSIIIHYQEMTSEKGHQFDKVTLESLLNDNEVKEWMKGMDEMALIPKKR